MADSNSTAVPVTLPSQAIDQYRCYYFGIVASVLLFGFMMRQTWSFFNYAAHHSRTPLWLQVFVGFIVASATVTTAIHIYLADFFLVTSAGNPAALADTGKYLLLLVSLLLLTLNTLGVQAFFGYQVWKVTQGRNYTWLVIIAICICAVLSFTASTVSLAIVWGNQAIIQTSRISILVGVNAASSTFCDLVAGIAFTIFLHNSKTGFKSTNQIINTIMFYTMQRGILLTICQVLVFISKIALPNSAAWLTFDMCLGKIYVNTFLAILNAKEGLRSNPRDYTASDSISLPQFGSRTAAVGTTGTVPHGGISSKGNPMEIIVSSEQTTSRDDALMTDPHWKRDRDSM